jgi:hypothetical protein
MDSDGHSDRPNSRTYLMTFDKLSAWEDKYTLADGEESEPRTYYATMAKLIAKSRLIDVFEVYFDRLHLDEFRFKSGRVNRRKVARAVVSLLIERNDRNAALRASPNKADYQNHENNFLKIPGLRTAEIIVQHLIDHGDD